VCKVNVVISTRLAIFFTVDSTLGQFHQCSTNSIYVRRSQRHKKLLDMTVFFALLVSAWVKAAHRTLMKLTPSFCQRFAKKHQRTERRNCISWKLKDLAAATKTEEVLLHFNYIFSNHYFHQRWNFKKKEHFSPLWESVQFVALVKFIGRVAGKKLVTFKYVSGIVVSCCRAGGPDEALRRAIWFMEAPGRGITLGGWFRLG